MRALTTSLALALAVSTVLAASDAQRRTRTPPQDRGEAAMTLGDMAWVASRASTRLANGRLTITATRSLRQGGVSTRESLTLQIADYKGPGDYVAAPIGSSFIAVGIDDKTIAAAEGDADAATKAAIATLSKARHMMLMGAKVTITAASETEISGTFSRPGTPGVDQPAISGGTFRAVPRP
ncbi:MAG: hypothetical protein AB7O32_00710 [Vicinamibacterales bacterium]